MPFLRTLLPCPPAVQAAPPRVDPCGQALQAAQTAIAAVAKTARLSGAGVEALSRWTCWIAYAARQQREPHHHGSPAWQTVLPVDTRNATDNLVRILRRAGEPPHVARAAAGQAYEQDFLCGGMAGPETYAPLLGAGTPALPAHAGPFEILPTWAQEIALFAANLAGKDMATIRNLSGLDLRWLRGYFADFGGCDLSGCDFSHADLRGARLRHAITDHARFDHALRDPAPSIGRRAYPRMALADTVLDIRGKKLSAHGACTVDFLGDKEILRVLPFVSVRQVDGIEVGYIRDGKTLIQQQGLRGCAAAAAAMLIADRGRPFNANALHETNPNNNDGIRRAIERAGLEAITTAVSTLDVLAEQIAQAGPAKIGVGDDQLGLHALIIDSVDLAASLAQLRDPFHGWAVIVALDALTRRLYFPTSIIQARLPDTPPSDLRPFNPATKA
jgi:hypothetical protein